MRKVIAAWALFVAVPYAWTQSPVHSPTTSQVEEINKATLQFRAQPDQPLSLPSLVLFGYPVCSSSGVTFLDFMAPPDYSKFDFVGISPNGKIQVYPTEQVPGLIHASVKSFDADDSGLYALVTGQRVDSLAAQNLAANDPQAQPRPYKNFVLHFALDRISPEVTELDLPFRPSRIASLDDNTWAIVGFDRVNRLPVLTLVDHSGKILRYVDTEHVFGTPASMINNAPASARKALDSLQEIDRVGALLTLVQFVHYRGSLLLLQPGKSAKIVTLVKGGQVESTPLHLPEGVEAKSLVSSDAGWFVRAVKSIDNSDHVDLILLQLDPASGDVVRLMSSPQLSADDITCVHAGEYLGIHWAGESEDHQKPYFMVGTP